MFGDDLNPKDFERRDAADQSVYVKFYMRPVLNEAKSNEEGRPIYDDREYVEIRTPGQQNNVVQRPVTDMDRQRFSRPYALFKAGESEQIVGTPLVEVPWITRSQVEELAHMRIRTLEGLANVSDGVCSQYAGMYKLKQRAQQAIADAKESAPFQKLQAENDEMKSKLASLEQVVREQSEIIAKMKQESATAKPTKS